MLSVSLLASISNGRMGRPPRIHSVFLDRSPLCFWSPLWLPFPSLQPSLPLPMASSLLSLTPKPSIAPRTISSPRRLFTSYAAALHSPPSLGKRSSLCFSGYFFVWLSVSCPFDLGVHGLGLGRVGLALGRSRSMVARSSAVAVANARDSRPIVVIDNYDSFTYNLCQVL